MVSGIIWKVPTQYEEMGTDPDQRRADLSPSMEDLVTMDDCGGTRVPKQ
jgi:hypothetical protein